MEQVEARGDTRSDEGKRKHRKEKKKRKKKGR